MGDWVCAVGLFAKHVLGVDIHRYDPEVALLPSGGLSPKKLKQLDPSLLKFCWCLQKYKRREKL